MDHFVKATAAALAAERSMSSTTCTNVAREGQQMVTMELSKWTLRSSRYRAVMHLQPRDFKSEHQNSQ